MSQHGMSGLAIERADVERSIIQTKKKKRKLGQNRMEQVSTLIMNEDEMEHYI